jgi:CRISPR-associated protein Cas5h
MKIISFHLKGKMAHFRRYYSNSSALSYTVPPRTTIIGIIAGLLGKERDSYYSYFSLEQCCVATAVCAPIKKIMQKMNLLMIKNANDLNGSQDNHSQTATELIIPQNIRTDALDYQVWFHHKDAGLMNEFSKLLCSGLFYHTKGINLGLGTAFSLGWLETDVMELDGEVKKSSEAEYIYSIIPSAKIKSLNVGMMTEGQYALLRENLPLEFNELRRITENGISSFIISMNGNPIPAMMESSVRLNDGKTIVWME